MHTHLPFPAAIFSFHAQNFYMTFKTFSFLYFSIFICVFLYDTVCVNFTRVQTKNYEIEKKTLWTIILSKRNIRREERTGFFTSKFCTSTILLDRHTQIENQNFYPKKDNTTVCRFILLNFTFNLLMSPDRFIEHTYWMRYKIQTHSSPSIHSRFVYKILKPIFFY